MELRREYFQWKIYLSSMLIILVAFQIFRKQTISIKESAIGLLIVKNPVYMGYDARIWEWNLRTI